MLYVPWPMGLPVKSSWPGYSQGTVFDPNFMPLFSGKGICPGCGQQLYIDWHAWNDTEKCSNCQHEFDGETALLICTSFEPAHNVGNIEKALEAIRLKKQWVVSQRQRPRPRSQPRPVRRATANDIAVELDDIATLLADQLR